MCLKGFSMNGDFQTHFFYGQMTGRYYIMVGIGILSTGRELFGAYCWRLCSCRIDGFWR